jgi:flagellar biosynthetic protein FliQ
LSPEAIVAVVRDGLATALTASAPLLLTALVVGLAIGLLQALTQVQEATLAFVPKLVAMGVVLLLSLPLIGGALGGYMVRIADHVAAGE